jgi:hypothetical protein
MQPELKQLGRNWKLRWPNGMEQNAEDGNLDSELKLEMS